MADNQFSDQNTSPTDDQDTSQNPSSPYYIHPNESPSSIIVTSPLAGNNYHSWSRSFKMALNSKNKIGFITSSIPVPTTKRALYPPWERCNNLIILWLLNSLSQSIAQSVIYFDHATDIWNDLQERFSQGDLLRIAELQEEIYALKQSSQNVTDYFTNLKTVWEELDNYCSLSSCTCFTQTYHQHSSLDF